ncbi:unnamed protein product [Sympodiomycopsis kandeliae]
METLRDTFFGQLVYRASGHKLFKQEEDKPGFQVPEKHQNISSDKNEKEQFAEGLKSNQGAPASAHQRGSPVTTPGGDRFFNAHHDERSLREAEGVTPSAPTGNRSPHSEGSSQRTLSQGQTNDVEKNEAGNKDSQNEPDEENDPNIVSWYGPDDPANPMNWSQVKKIWVVFNLCALTFTIYMGSSIVSPALPLFAQFHGISIVVATLGLTLFVVGYGVGPMVLSPLSEIPQIGRNPPYIITLAIFVILQVPTALTDSLAGYLVLRFLAGVFGSPALATGGATISDMFPAKTRAPWVGIWGLSAVSGPALGPLIGGFASQALGWRWSIWPLLFATGGSLTLMTFGFPETSSQNILYRRAVRLRKLTGNKDLKTAGEIAAAQMTGKDIAMMTLVRPFTMTILDPMVLLNNLEIGLVYSVLYSFFESFPLVFEGVYGFNAGEQGVAFLSILVFSSLTWLAFFTYSKVRLEKVYDQRGGKTEPEDRLEPAFGTLIFLPIALFGFGWTSTASIHWIAPVLFAGSFSIATFCAFQSVLNFLVDSYPTHAASVLASNDLFRSLMGAAFPLFSRQMFTNLQAINGPTAFPVAWGCTLLGCISILFVPLPFIFHRYGPALRRRSRYAS